MNEESEKDQKWVDDLLAQLPTPKPVPDDVSRHLDQFLAERVAELQAQSNVVSISSSRSSTRASGSFTRRYQFMLAAAAVTGLLAFVGTQNSLFTNNSDRTSVASQENPPNDEPIVDSNSQNQEEPGVVESPADDNSSDNSKEQPSNSKPAEQTPENDNSSEMIDPEATATKIQVLGSEGGTGYLPNDAPDVQVTNSGMDYATNLVAILDEVAPYGEAGKVNKLSTSQLKCIVQLKLVDRVIAVDAGKYKGSNVVTFFAFADDGTTKAYVTGPGNNCTLVKKISIN
jgi:hypothetical protein